MYIKVLSARRQELDSQIDDLNKKIAWLMKKRGIEAGASRKFQIDEEIRECTEDRMTAAYELEDIDRQLAKYAWVVGPNQPSPDSPPPAESTIHFCDRTEQDAQFKRHFESASESRPHAPKFYFIHGEMWDNPDSLVLRFRDTYIRERIRKGGDETRTVVDHGPAVDWPYMDDLASRRKELLYALFRRIDPNHEGTDYTAESLRRLLLSKADHCFVIQHELHVKHWDWTTRRLLKWYLDYWDKVKADADLPPCVLFFCVIYEGTQAAEGAGLRGAGRKLRRKTFALRLKLWFNRPARVVRPRAPACCSTSVVLDALSCVTMEEFVAWLKRTGVRHDPALQAQWCAEVFETSDPRAAECKMMFHVEAKLSDMRQVLADLYAG